MTNPKMKPCPVCGSEHVAVWTYESGMRYVECDSGTSCWYRGPGEGSIRQAIKSHNTKHAATAAAMAPRPVLSELEIAALCGGKKAAARLRSR